MQDMTKGNPLRIILAFAVPLLLTNVCQQCYRIAGACLSHPLAWIGAVTVTSWYYFRKIRKLKRNGIPVRIERAAEL